MHGEQNLLEWPYCPIPTMCQQHTGEHVQNKNRLKITTVFNHGILRFKKLLLPYASGKRPRCSRKYNIPWRKTIWYFLFLNLQMYFYSNVYNVPVSFSNCEYRTSTSSKVIALLVSMQLHRNYHNHHIVSSYEKQKKTQTFKKHEKPDFCQKLCACKTLKLNIYSSLENQSRNNRIILTNWRCCKQLEITQLHISYFIHSATIITPQSPPPNDCRMFSRLYQR